MLHVLLNSVAHRVEGDAPDLGGRVVDQEIARITKAFAEGQVRGIPAFQEACARARAGCKLHLLGLVSDAGVHGVLEHLYALLRLAREAPTDFRTLRVVEDPDSNEELQ